MYLSNNLPYIEVMIIVIIAKTNPQKKGYFYVLSLFG